jgi:hypothetical protein
MRLLSQRSVVKGTVPVTAGRCRCESRDPRKSIAEDLGCGLRVFACGCSIFVEASPSLCLEADHSHLICSPATNRIAAVAVLASAVSPESAASRVPEKVPHDEKDCQSGLGKMEKRRREVCESASERGPCAVSAASASGWVDCLTVWLDGELLLTRIDTVGAPNAELDITMLLRVVLGTSPESGLFTTPAMNPSVTKHGFAPMSVPKRARFTGESGKSCQRWPHQGECPEPRTV